MDATTDEVYADPIERRIGRRGTIAVGLAALRPDGRLLVSGEDPSSIRLSKDDPGRQPRIELSVDPHDQSPHIMLRDVSGRVVWQAP